MMSCELCGQYKETLWKLKCYDTKSRIYRCSFRLRGYYTTINVYKFNILYGVHNYELDHKLGDYPIVSHLDGEEKKIFVEITMNMVLSKNILTTLKRKRPDIVTIN